MQTAIEQTTGFDEVDIPKYSFAVHERKDGDCGFQVVDVIVAPWLFTDAAPRFYFLKRWATKHISPLFMEEVINDFEDCSAKDAGWYRMNFDQYCSRIANQEELFSEIIYEEEK